MRLLLVLFLCLAGAPLAYAVEAVELDYRLRANRDLVSEQMDENVTTIRVIEDRGLVAKVAANGGRFPQTSHTINRQRSRYTTGPAQPDGSFDATLTILGHQASLRLATGEEQPVEGRPSIRDLVFKAIIDPQGRVLQPSLAVEGADPAAIETIKSVMVNVLEQVTRVEVMRVEPHKPTEQVLNMMLPLPGMAPLSLKVNASNRLIEVKDGQARIEMVYVMDFGVPEGPVKIEATGTGGGTFHFDIAAKIARRTETNTLMTVIAHGPDGTLEIQMNMRQTQQTQEAER
jgi:hypothetical protein